MLAAAALVLTQAAVPLAGATGARPALAALTDFQSAQSHCVVLASGRLVPGISIVMSGPHARYLPLGPGAHSGVRLPDAYRDARLFRVNRALPASGSGDVSPVVIAWDEDRRACAVVARLPALGRDAAAAARTIVERYGFVIDADGRGHVSFPANPAVMAPSADLTFVPDADTQDDVVVTRVENGKR